MRQFGVVEKIDWCDAIKNLVSVKNVFSKKLIQEMKNVLPAGVFKCPLFGKIEASNTVSNIKIFKILPKGVYVITFFFDFVNDNAHFNGSATIQQP